MGVDDILVGAKDLENTISTEDGVSVNSDDALLMSMGKKPELKRVYNFWTRMLMPRRDELSNHLP